MYNLRINFIFELKNKIKDKNKIILKNI